MRVCPALILMYLAKSHLRRSYGGKRRRVTWQRSPQRHACAGRPWPGLLWGTPWPRQAHAALPAPVGPSLLLQHPQLLSEGSPSKERQGRVGLPGTHSQVNLRRLRTPEMGSPNTLLAASTEQATWPMQRRYVSLRHGQEPRVGLSWRAVSEESAQHELCDQRCLPTARAEQRCCPLPTRHPAHTGHCEPAARTPPPRAGARWSPGRAGPVRLGTKHKPYTFTPLHPSTALTCMRV